ncbi:MAG: tryptophan-rich sensory protein [Lachnospiraceae bacterium]|nr:tryptophan-rich sensory protein [Lachnospiraceae bacterium]
MTETKTQKKHVVALIIAILIPLAVGGVSALLAAKDMRFYDIMNHPLLAPPGWVFPIVWTILYIMMGYASYLVFTADTDPDLKLHALIFYGAQLVMNFFWPLIFFVGKNYLVALLLIVMMWVAVLISTIQFFRVRKLAGCMMLVLLLWTTFATYLNIAYYIMSITPMPIPR